VEGHDGSVGKGSRHEDERMGGGREEKKEWMRA
jgi:hypothetical protein